MKILYLIDNFSKKSDVGTKNTWRNSELKPERIFREQIDAAKKKTRILKNSLICILRLNLLRIGDARYKC